MIMINSNSSENSPTISAPIIVDEFFTGKKKEYVNKEIRDLINSSLESGRCIVICKKKDEPDIITRIKQSKNGPKKESGPVHGNLTSPKALPVELTEEVLTKVKYLIRRGSRIGAIKEVQNTNLFSSLSECRDFVLNICNEQYCSVINR